MDYKIERRKLLTLLYQERLANPKSGWVKEKDITDALGDCDFSLSVLEELGHLVKDGRTYRITGAGVVAVEQ